MSIWITEVAQPVETAGDQPPVVTDQSMDRFGVLSLLDDDGGIVPGQRREPRERILMPADRPIVGDSDWDATIGDRAQTAKQPLGDPGACEATAVDKKPAGAGAGGEVDESVVFARRDGTRRVGRESRSGELDRGGQFELAALGSVRVIKRLEQRSAQQRLSVISKAAL